MQRQANKSTLHLPLPVKQTSRVLLIRLKAVGASADQATKPLKIQLAYAPPGPQSKRSILRITIGGQPSDLKSRNIQRNRGKLVQIENQQPKVFLDFLEAVIQQVNSCRYIYGQFIGIEEILIMLNTIKMRSVSRRNSKEIINLVLDFLAFCKNKFGCWPTLRTTFTLNYPKQLSVKWMKIREQTYYYNKRHLHILGYIVKKPQKGKPEFGGCFQELEFDFSDQQSKKVAEIAFKMAKEDSRSFCFLSNYLLLSCKVLENKNEGIKEIETRYVAILRQLCLVYRPAPEIIAEDEHLDLHQSYNHEELAPKMFIELKGRPDKQKVLEDFIMERATESISHLSRFEDILKEVCNQNGGFRFKAGVKIKERSQHGAMLRIKEKMLSSYLSLKENGRHEGDPEMKQDSLSIDQTFANQKQAYINMMERIFDTLDQPLQFKVTDMLRGKCFFADVHQINSCCSSILRVLEKSQNNGIEIIEIDNRLRKGTSDLVLKILFGNVVAELQLVINLNAAEYQFNHKIYELLRSKFYSPLAQLVYFNQKISVDYFTEAKTVIDANIRTESLEDYEEATTYLEVSQYFNGFLAILPVKIDFPEKGINEVDLKEMEEEMRMYKQIAGCAVKGRMEQQSMTKLRQGLYLYEIKQYDKAEKKLDEALHHCSIELRGGNLSEGQKNKKELRKAEIYQAKGDIVREKGHSCSVAQQYSDRLVLRSSIKGNTDFDANNILVNFDNSDINQCDHPKAIQLYERCLQIQQRIKGIGSIETAATLINLGLVYESQGNYLKAIDYYQQCLQIQEREEGGDCMNITETLNSLGLVNLRQGNNAKAIDYSLRSLNIVQKIKGRGSIDTSAALNNLGLVYWSQGNYSKAIEYYEKCLQIQEINRGKGSFCTAFTLRNLGSVYLMKGDKSKAIELYTKCLLIQQKIKGKGSIDTAITLRDIGMVYFDQGDFPSAKEYYLRCLQIQESIKGKESADTAGTFNNLGTVFQCEGCTENALKCFFKCLQIYESTQGKDSFDSALILSNIGIVYFHQGDYPQAIRYYEKSFQIQQRIKGRESVGTVIVINNLGSIFQNQGNYPKAIQYFQKAFDIVQKVKGKDCIDISVIKCNLGQVYCVLGDYPRAIKQYEKSLQIQERIRGIGSVDTAVMLNNIGSVHQKLGEYSKAYEYFIRGLSISETIKGKGSIDTAIPLRNIGLVHYNQNDNPKAMKYFSQCLQIQEKIKGKGCIDSADTLSCIGMVYQKIGDFSNASQFYSQDLQIKERVKGKGSKETSSTLKQLGLVMSYQRDFVRAAKYLDQCLQIQQRIQGKGCLSSAGTLGIIGEVYRHQGNYTKAIEFFSQSLEILERMKGKGSIQTFETICHIGIAISQKRDFHLALQYLWKGVQISEKVNGRRIFANAELFSLISVIYVHQKNYLDAIGLMKQAISIYQQYSNLPLARDRALILHHCLKKANLTEEANELTRKYGF